MKLLVREALPVSTVANKCGVHRSTIWRWKRKWDELNKNVEFGNPNRPGRAVSLKNKLAACKWHIATESPKPLSCSHAIGKVMISRIMELRSTLKRNHAYDGARKNRVRPDSPRRPKALFPGELVQTDTIHYICPSTFRRRYVYTVIDLYSRTTHSEIHPKIAPGLAADVVLRA